MKKISLLIVFLVSVMCLLSLVGIMRAEDYTVAVTSHNPVGSLAGFTKGGFPNITAGAKIDKIILSNGGATAQVVILFDTCTSSMVATAAMTVDMPAAIGTLTIDLPFHNPLILTNLGIKKSSAASAVNANIIYR